jgi:predicted ABC-type ATPase
MPELFILTGSNGAGKSSVGPEYLSPHLRSNVFDGDKLFMQKRSEFWRNGIPSHKECKKMAAEFVEKTFDDLVETVLHQNIDFAYEGHFTNDATWNIPKRFKEEGYKINLIFLGLKDVTISEARVITRSKEGGHYVDPLTLRSNFYGNLEKLEAKIFATFKQRINLNRETFRFLPGNNILKSFNTHTFKLSTFNFLLLTFYFF